MSIEHAPERANPQHIAGFEPMLTVDQACKILGISRRTWDRHPDLQALAIRIGNQYRVPPARVRDVLVDRQADAA